MSRNIAFKKLTVVSGRVQLDRLVLESSRIALEIAALATISIDYDTAQLNLDRSKRYFNALTPAGASSPAGRKLAHRIGAAQAKLNRLLATS